VCVCVCVCVCLDVCDLETKTVRRLGTIWDVAPLQIILTELTWFSSVRPTGSRLQSPSWEGSSSSDSH